MYNHIFLRTMLCCAAFLFIISCRKDDQRFVYEQLNRVSISPDSSFTITQYDTLRFTPVYTDTKKPKTAYTYEWLIYPQLGSGTPTVLSNDASLKAQIRQSPGSYSMQCRVTDPETGIVAIKLYSITVNGKFYSGVLVSTNRAGAAQLDFLRADDTLIFNPGGVVNSTTYPGKALAALSTISGSLSIILFFTDKGAYRFNGNDFFQNATTPQLFTGDKTFATLPAYANNALGTEQLVISEGGLYAGISTGLGGTEELAMKPFSERFNGDYYLFPGIASSSLYTSYVYDNKYRRFMQTAYGTRQLTASTIRNDFFDMATVGKTAIGFDRGAIGTFYANGEYYFIMKDDADGRYIYSIKDDAPAMYQKIENSPDITQAKYFATATTIKQLYYATDSKLYLYDITAKTAELLYTFPAGFKIADIKMQRSGTTRLVAGVNNGASGEVYYFDLDVRGRLVNNTYAKKFSGFGEIVHIGFRN